MQLYKYVFPPHISHATLAVIGLVQAIGAVMPISELQSRWFVNLLIGKLFQAVNNEINAFYHFLILGIKEPVFRHSVDRLVVSGCTDGR